MSPKADPHKFTTLEMQALAECLNVCFKYTICPTCKAQGEFPCETSSGTKVSYHITRVKQAHAILATPFDEAMRNEVQAYLGE